MANPVPPLPLKTPLADQAGLLTPAWTAWFRELFTRVGGTSASTNSQLLALIENLQADVNVLQGGLTQGRDL